MLRPLKKLLGEREVNDFLRESQALESFEFAEKLLEYFDASYTIVGRELERIPAEGAVLLAVGCPLGLLESAALLKLIGQIRRDVRIVANDLLMPLAPLAPLLVPPHAIHAALENGEVVIAGRSAGWQAPPKAPVLPVHMRGRRFPLFAGLSVFFLRNAILPIRIGGPARLEKGKVIALRGPAPVAHPEERGRLRRELQRAACLGETQDGKQIFLFDPPADSAVLRELGRLREIAFRQVGEGTGRRRDVDRFDSYYRHVVLWDDAELQIAGAYRIGEAGRIAAERGEAGLYTHGLFAYGEALRARLPAALELGRSFVQPRYQGLRALDYLWSGIGAYLATRPDVRYLFGPVSLSATYPQAARRLLVHFFARQYGAAQTFATARRPLDLTDAGPVPTDLRMLKEDLAAMGVSIPVLYKQYADLCEPGGTQFLAFGSDPAFANCVDALVLVDLERLKPAKRERYLGAARRLDSSERRLKSA